MVYPFNSRNKPPAACAPSVGSSRLVVTLGCTMQPAPSYTWVYQAAGSLLHSVYQHAKVGLHVSQYYSIHYLQAAVLFHNNKRIP